MSQQLKSSPVSQPADTLVYRPVSGFAVASLILASVYSLVILVLGGMAMYYGDALPLGTWSLLFPIAAAVLALLARRQIRLSEGTRSGSFLASCGWWLSIGFGLGYTAIYVGTYLALTWQAQTFATRFLEYVRDGKLNHAFLLTQAPDERGDPDNQREMMIRHGAGAGAGRKPPLQTFYGQEFIRLLQQAGKDAVIHNLGVNLWEYDKGYHIVQSYRVTTPEGDFDAALSMRSSEDRKTRGWRIAGNESDLGATKSTLSPYGEALRKWRQESQLFIFFWLQKRNFALMDLDGTTGRMDQLFLDTLEPSQRSIWKSAYACALAGDVAAFASVLGTAGQDSLATHWAQLDSTEWRWNCYYPGYAQFYSGALVKTDKLEAAAKYRDEVRKEAANLFNHRSRALLKQTEGNTGAPEPFDTKTQRLRVAHSIDLDSVDVDPAADALKFHAEGQLIVESDPGEFTVSRTPQWRIVGLNLLTADQPPPPDPRRAPEAPPRREPRTPRAVQPETK